MAGLVHPVHLSIICHLFGPGDRKFFVESLPRGVGHLSNHLKAVSVVPFSIFHLKICLFR